MIKSRQNDYFDFRVKYPEFVYHGYELSESDDKLVMDFHFEITGLSEFRPHWEIDKLATDSCVDVEDKRLDELAFSLGMVELVSYWKITCSPNVKITCGALSAQQAQWWKKLYSKGLGEFFYVNDINADYNDFINIINSNNVIKDIFSNKNTIDNNKVLIPIGGGKDSAVTLELLKDYTDRYCYIINPRKATTDTITASGIAADKVIIATRSLDKNMLDLNKQGFLNGHTPFSALVAFSSIIAAYINSIGFVALSNESSANESTVLGSDVNHQYSKSVKFETDFIEYEAKYISSGVKYFSLLRPMTELGIARLFSKMKQYHAIFRSCNVGSKDDVWCAACSKCLFVYIILAPFLSEDEMIYIFGHNMLNDEAMIPTFEQLVGVTPEKPFECVGSRDEVNAAVQELIRQYEARSQVLPKLPEYYKGLNITESYDLTEICYKYNNENHIPDSFISSIRNALSQDIADGK